MQINRLFEIVYILINKKNITARKLAEHFEVSQRTIYRDIDTLCECGIPIYTNKGKGGGIRLIDNFILNKSLLSPNEQNEILSALQSLRATNYADNNSALIKLSSLFGMENTNWIKVDFSDWNSDNDNNFTSIKYAILNNRIISFDYFSSYGEKTTRSVEPLQLWFKDKNWYLKAFCLLKKQPRIFKLSRIKNLKLSQETFERRILDEETFETRIENTSDSKLIHLKLKIDSSQSFRVYDEFDYNSVHKNDDGSFIVTTSYPPGEWVYSYVLSFGQFIQVLEPESFKNELKNKIETMYKLYN